RPGSDRPDVGWFGPDGHEMDEEEWAAGRVRALGMFLNGGAIAEPGPRGEPITDESFLVLLNGEDSAIGFRLPGSDWAVGYEMMVDSSGADRSEDGLTATGTLLLCAHSAVVLRSLS
ncbi:MAG: glycogen debranching enzyme, partial [Acidimicrobiales bacterium]